MAPQCGNSELHLVKSLDGYACMRKRHTRQLKLQPHEGGGRATAGDRDRAPKTSCCQSSEARPLTAVAKDWVQQRRDQHPPRMRLMSTRPMQKV